MPLCRMSIPGRASLRQHLIRAYNRLPRRIVRFASTRRYMVRPGTKKTYYSLGGMRTKTPMDGEHNKMRSTSLVLVARPGVIQSSRIEMSESRIFADSSRELEFCAQGSLPPREFGKRYRSGAGYLESNTFES